MFYAIRSFVMNTAYSAVLILSTLPAIGASLQTETFDSAASAAANGWALQNGVGNWGWQFTNNAGGGAIGEARADSFSAGYQRWYADTDLGGTLSFTEDWAASGRMDFLANSQSDGGMMLGFFNRNTSLSDSNQTVAGFLLVNNELRLRFERRPNTADIETLNFGLWTNEDHLFSLVWDSDGAGIGTGRLSASLIRVADNTTVTRSLDISQDLLVGATMNSFGFYAMDFARDRPTPFDWVVDDLVYGPGSPQSVVPIPPTVWLFGSALGLMGVMRRKFGN